MIRLSEAGRAKLAAALDAIDAEHWEPSDAALVRLALAIGPTLATQALAPPGGSPAAAEGIATYPLTERWCSLLAPLADVDDDELGLAALHAVRWLRVTAADRARQVEAAVALGLDWSGLAEISTLAHCPTSAVQRLGLSAELVASWSAVALEDRRLLCRAERVIIDRVVTSPGMSDIELEQGAIAAQVVMIEASTSISRPWCWCWESCSYYVGKPHATPCVVPGDWRPEWGDRHGVVRRRTEGVVLVVQPADVPEPMGLGGRVEVAHDPGVAPPAVRRPRPTLIAVPNDPPTAPPARPAAAGGWPSSHHEWPGSAIELEAYLRGER